MNILQVVRAFLPHLDKDRVLEDLRVTSGELDNFALPSYRQAAEHFKLNKIKSQVNIDLVQSFYRVFDLQGMPKQPNVAAEVLKRLVFIKDNTDYILTLAETLYERDIINEGLTAKKAVILKAASAVSFISRYSIDLLNFLYVHEAGVAGADVEEGMTLSPAALKYITENLPRFARMVSDYGIPTKKFSNIVLGLPEVALGSKTADTVKGLYKDHDIDPFGNQFKSGFTGNPIYHIRLQVAEWQSNRYKANKEKKKVLELRLLYLKEQKEGRVDAKLQQEISYTQDRVDKINRYLSEVEEDLAA